MKRSRITALLALSISTSFSCFYAGCGSSDDDIVTGSGGAGGGGTGGSYGTGGGSVADAKSDATGGMDAGADGHEASTATPDTATPEASTDTGPRLDAAPDQRDAGADAVADVSADRVSTDTGADVRVDAGPDVSVTPDAGPEGSAPEAEASVDSATVDQNSADVVDAGAPEVEVDTGGGQPDTGGGQPDAVPPGDGSSGEAGTSLCSDTSTTEACIASLGPDCSQCAIDNGCFDSAIGAGRCEEVQGTAPAACAGPAGTSGAPTETQLCFAAIQNILNSGCASTFQLTPCLCGRSDSIACTAGTAPALGPVQPIYACELGATGPAILNSFTDPTFGAGKANAILVCLGSLCGTQCLQPRQ